MGGRGSYSYSSGSDRDGGGSKSKENVPLSLYAVASLNSGIAKGTTPEAAIERYRQQLMSSDVEYSAWVDDAGYVHSLASVGKAGSTRVVPFYKMPNETGISTVVHNHPADKQRLYGGTFSQADLSYLATYFNASGGKVKKIVATAREGTYTAVATKALKKYANSPLSLASAVNSAEKRVNKSLSGKTWTSKKAKWAAIHEAVAREYGKIGFDISYQPQKKASRKLITQKIGELS